LSLSLLIEHTTLVCRAASLACELLVSSELYAVECVLADGTLRRGPRPLARHMPRHYPKVYRK